MSFTIVTVLHDSAPELQRLLPSLREHVAARRRRSWSSTPARATTGRRSREAAGAEVVVLDGNPGFGAASNAGVAAARHDVTVLLNPDCELLDDGLAELAARAAGGEALLVPRLLEADGALQRSAHPLPGRPMALVRAVLPTRALPQPHRARRPRRVGWAIAACLAAPTALLRRLGPFDPDAFLFYEDMDLCLRAHARGRADRPAPRGRGAPSRRAQHRAASSAARPSTCRRAAVARSWARASGARALRYDDGAQALTFGLRAAVGRERGRNVAALRALRAARRMATAARS